MLSNLKSWWGQPFSVDMSAPQWAAFLGLLIVILIVWGIVLRHIERATS